MTIWGPIGFPIPANYEDCVRSRTKSMAYLAAGKPILKRCGNDPTDLVRAAGAGIVFAPGQAADGCRDGAIRDL
jgi:hypothetical protein